MDNWEEDVNKWFIKQEMKAAKKKKKKSYENNSTQIIKETQTKTTVRYYGHLSN